MDYSNTSSLFAARTRKRHRDNRPAERDVYRMSPLLPSTNHSNPHPPVRTLISTEHTLSLLYNANQNQKTILKSLPEQIEEQPTPALPEVGRQSSLHAFFKMEEVSRTTVSPEPQVGGGDVEMMDIDGEGDGGMDGRRREGGRVWVGGLGWVSE